MNDKTSISSKIADAKGNGTIRLGCVHCDRRDQEGISMLPESWESIASVQEWVGIQCDLVTSPSDRFPNRESRLPKVNR